MKETKSKKTPTEKTKGVGHPENPTVPNAAHAEMKGGGDISACVKKNKGKEG